MIFTNWLAITRELQAKSYGRDPHDLEGEELAEFITWNTTALVAEIGEMLQEFPGWKPWVVERGKDINREAMIGEIVDQLHFQANILAALQCTDEELTAFYMAKVAKNRARMASGTYDGVSDKCPVCKRELLPPRGPGESPYCPEHSSGVSANA